MIRQHEHTVNVYKLKIFAFKIQKQESNQDNLML